MKQAEKFKIFIIALYTNGHEAAIKLIKTQGWKPRQYELIPCGSHGILFHKWRKEGGYAVLPIFNTVLDKKGMEIETVGPLKQMQQLGYVYTELASTVLKVTHYLGVGLHVGSINELDGIYVSQPVRDQCSKFFSNRLTILIPTLHSSSTAESAEKVARVESKRMKMAGVTTKNAMVHFKLKSIKNDIGDESSKTNHTTFLLLKLLKKESD